jgi:hypothetical protein
VRGTDKVAGNGAGGAGRSGSRAATVATDAFLSLVARIRDVAAPRAPGAGELLGLLGRDVVGQGAPEPLRRDVVGLLDYAFAVAAPAARGGRRPASPRARCRSSASPACDTTP